jgi:hypothetical protein
VKESLGRGLSFANYEPGKIHFCGQRSELAHHRPRYALSSEVLRNPQRPNLHNWRGRSEGEMGCHLADQKTDESVTLVWKRSLFSKIELFEALAVVGVEGADEESLAFHDFVSRGSERRLAQQGITL